MIQLTIPPFDGPKEMLRRMFKNDAGTIAHSYDVFYLVQDFYGMMPMQLKVELNRTDLFNAALLHDIGKSVLPKIILNKPGELTPGEREIIKTHAEFGKDLLEGTPYEHLSDMVRYHHERVDGNGYYGLCKNEIPLESKIIAIADTYSALTSNRVYRLKCKVNKAYKILYDATGTQLDEKLTFLFCKSLQNNENMLSGGYRYSFKHMGLSYAN